MNERLRKDVGDLTSLIKSIKEVGLIHPIVVDSNGVLIAGYRRLKACEELGIEPEYRVIDFDDPLQAEIDENVVRKDFTPGEIFEINGYYNRKLSKKPGPKVDDNSCPNRTVTFYPRDVVAEVTGVGRTKLSQINSIFNSNNEEIKQKVNEGIISVDKGAKEVKKEERKKDIDLQKKEIANTEFRINGLYNIIVIDPPWNYGREYDPDGSRVANPYPEMNFDELNNIQIPAESNCIMWLWTTHAFIFEARKLLSNWGFEYKAILVWDKQKMGMGSWLRMQCEFCLLGIKGNPIWDVHYIRDIISEPRREHSRKPEAFYTMIDNNFAGKKLEYFSRSKRNGWEVIGNDTEKF